MNTPSPEALASRAQAGWSSLLARTVGAILLFELVSGLTITLGPFRPATEWGLLLHTIAEVITIAPFAWYLVRHWRDYSDQALSDVLLLGYVGMGALAGSGARVCSNGRVPSPAAVIGALGCQTQQGSSANASPVRA